MWNTIFKWTLGILLVVLVCFLIFFGGTIYLDKKMDDTAQSEDEDSETIPSNEGLEETEQEVKELSKEKFEKHGDKNLNPFGDPFTPDEVSDSMVQDYIHYMSHQKVIANEKWGFYRITDERISWLVQAVEENKYLKHADTYKYILNDWQSGDFAQADQHHNTIWELQGGTIGRASGVMSEEQEQQYLNRASEGR